MLVLLKRGERIQDPDTVKKKKIELKNHFLEININSYTVLLIKD